MATSEQETLCEMLNEKRRLEFIAREADNAVLRQSIAIWKRFQVYPGVGAGKRKEMPRQPSNLTDALRLTVNGTPLSSAEAADIVRSTFPELKVTGRGVDSGLAHLTRRQELFAVGVGRPYKYTDRKQ